MSVQQNHYEIIGAKFGYNEFHKELMAAKGLTEEEVEDLLDDYHDSAFKGIQHHNGLCIICDGMNGEYVYVGHILQKSGNYGRIGEFKSQGKNPSAKAVRKMMVDQLGLDRPCRRCAFTHYR